MTRLFEYWYPRLSGLAGSAIYLVWLRHIAIPATFHDVFGAVLTIASITVGFLITAASTLLSIQESNTVVRRARRAGAYRDLVEYVISAARWNFAAALASAAALLVDLNKFVGWYPYAFAVWVGLVITGALTMTRIFKLLTMILRLNADPDR